MTSPDSCQKLHTRTGLRALATTACTTQLRAARLIAVLAMSLLVAGTSGCNSSDSSETEVPSNLSVGFQAKIQTLNPYQALDYPSLAALHLIGGNLLEASGPEGQTIPGLASKLVVSQDQRVWTFTLRPGLKFSDGSDLTSADVKATFEYAKALQENFQALQFAPITRVDTPDATTVVLHTSRPYPSLRRILGLWSFSIFPAAKIEQKGFFNDPVSAGPYRLESWGGGDTAVFTRNRHYMGSKPRIGTVTFRTIPDPNSALAQVKSGQLDMAYSLPPNLIPQINGSLVRQVVPLFGSETLTPLTTHPPLNDIRVRRGINAALERPKIASTTWHGEVKPFAGFWPSTMRGYDSSIPTAPDLTAARDFLRGSGCDPKCDLTLSYSATAYPEHASEALVVQSSLKQVGIDLRLVDLDATTYFNNLTGQKFQLILQPIYDLTDVPDGLTAYGLIPEIQKALLSNLVIPGISTVVDRALTTTGATQDAALQAVQDQYLSHLPWFSLTDYALVTAQRVATSVAKVPSSSVVAVVRQNGDVR